MGWGEYASSMVKTMKSNNSLLRVKSVFTIITEEKERNIGRKALKGRGFKIEPLSDELRSQLQKESEKRRRKSRVVAFVAIIITTFVLGVVYNFFSSL